MKTPHQQMVSDLVKPGADILASLTPEKCNIVHMNWGLVGEHMELTQGFMALQMALADPTSKPDYENVIEELGDMHFYLEALAQAFDCQLTLLEALFPEIQDSGPMELLNAVEGVSDILKKYVMYDKPLTGEQTQELHEGFATIYASLHNLARSLQVTPEEVLEANMQKLLKGDTARYKDGSYSDEQAQNRADKAEDAGIDPTKTDSEKSATLKVVK